MSRACETAYCPNPATRYVSCEGEDAWPYCDECATVLIGAGGEIDHGPVDGPPVDVRVSLAAAIDWVVTNLGPVTSMPERVIRDRMTRELGPAASAGEQGS